jgi:sec-independent protein translocase protein TatB
MHLGDSIFILILALVLLGPKKTSELAGHLGKLMAEFRKASNDFKYQFNEEMRVAEQTEQQKKQDAERATLSAGTITGAVAPPALEPGGGAAALTTEHSILPPALAPIAAESDTAPASEGVPYAISATTGEEHPIDDHPLLRVDVIPPMEPVQAGPIPGETAESAQNAASAELDAARDTPPTRLREEDGAPLHHG